MSSMRSAAGPVAGLREVDPDEAAADGCKPSTGSVAATVPAAGPTAEEIEVPVGANLNRAITALITAVPPLLLGLGAWQMWNHGLQWRDVAIFLVMYIPVGLGVTIGFHRLLTHRSFKTSPAMRGLLGILGTLSIEGPVISWVGEHRTHHASHD